MTRKLNELFNLPEDDEDSSTDITPAQEEDIPESLMSEELLDTMDKIENALPAVKGLESSDADMDEIANLAKEAFNNLMDLGFQVDSRFSAEIFNSASGFLGHSLSARTAKVNKKLKMLDLQLKKAELDRKLAAAQVKGEATPETTQLGTGQVLDRNELIKQILEQSKSSGKDK